MDEGPSSDVHRRAERESLGTAEGLTRRDLPRGVPAEVRLPQPLRRDGHCPGERLRIGPSIVVSSTRSFEAIIRLSNELELPEGDALYFHTDRDTLRFRRAIVWLRSIPCAARAAAVSGTTVVSGTTTAPNRLE
jgi:hypothetical protein